MKSVIIITGGISTVPFLEAARERELNIILFDLNPEAPCVPHSDLFFPMSTHDSDSVMEKILELKQKYDIKGVLCYSSAQESLITASYICRQLNLPGFTGNSIKVTYNKDILHNIFSKISLSIPERYHKDQIEGIIIPCVLKEIEGIGSKGTQLINDKKILAQKISELESNSKRYIIEEYVDGILIHIDGFVQNGDSQIINIVEKSVINIDSIPLTGGYRPCPELFDNNIYDNLREQLYSGVTNLDINNHYFGADIILKEDFSDFKIIEIGYLLDAKMDRLLYHCGYPVYDILLDIIDGTKVELNDQLQFQSNKCLVFLYAPKNGKLLIRNKPEHLVEWEKQEQDEVKIPDGIADILGWCIYDSQKVTNIADLDLFKIE